MPGIMEIIKAQVDREGQIPGRFLLSGSANFALLKGVSESLAGRAIYIEMFPFSRREILRTTSSEPFLRTFFRKPSLPRGTVSPKPVSPAEILRGGMPRVALGGVRNPSTWFTGYEQTYIERDVRQLTQVADLISFRRAVRLSAFRTGKILKISELARDAQLPVATLSRYLGVMETSCCVRPLAGGCPSLLERAGTPRGGFRHRRREGVPGDRGQGVHPMVRFGPGRPARFSRRRAPLPRGDSCVWRPGIRCARRPPLRPADVATPRISLPPCGEDISLFMIDDQAVPFLAQNGFIARQFELAGNA